MPQAETYGARKQTLAPDGQARLNSTVTANTFGAQKGAALQTVASGVQNVAASVDAVREMEDKVLVEERVNEYSDFTRERTYDPQNGYVNQQGQNAVEGRAAYNKDLEDNRKTLGAGLTPAQHKLYDRATQARSRQAMDTGIRHASQERRRWFDDASTARLNTFANDALAMSNEPDKLRTNMAAGDAEIQQRAALNGWGAEQTEAARGEFRSGVHKNIVLKNAITDPLGAKAWLDQNRENMTATHAVELDRALDAPVLAAQAQVEAERIAAGGQNPSTLRPSFTPARGGHSENDGHDHGKRTIKAASDRVDFTGVEPEAEAAFHGLEDALGFRLTVTSAFRSEADNKRVKGAKNSQHKHGNAFDISVAGKTKEERKEIIRQAHAAGFRGFGIGSNIIHIDQGGQRAWGYVTSAGGGSVPDWAAGTINEVFAGGASPNDPAAGPEFVGPQYINDQVASIADPRLRAQTAATLSKMYGAQDAAQRRADQQNKLAAEKFIITNPGTDPTKLPLEIQQQLGVDGMNTLWAYNAQVASQGAVRTDEAVYAKLQRLQAEDPAAFSTDVDMFDFLGSLSTKDRREFQQLQVDAIKDGREGKETALTAARSITSAMSIADARLEAVGVRVPAKQATDETRTREARFQRALVDRMREFQMQEERVPNDYEVSDIVDQLLLPIIIKEPGTLWGTNDTEASIFEAPFRADNATVEIDVPYETIPVDLRLAIRQELVIELGREPTEDEVKADYVEFVLKGS